MRLMRSRASALGLLNRQLVGAADGCPNLFAIGVAGDGDEDVRALRHHPDVVATQLGVGHRIAFSLLGKGRDHAVGENLAPLAAGGLADHWATQGLTRELLPCLLTPAKASSQLARIYADFAGVARTSVC